MTGVTDVVSQLGGLADWRIGGGADSRNTERPPVFHYFSTFRHSLRQRFLV
jgi:hypothetical protein